MQHGIRYTTYIAIHIVWFFCTVYSGLALDTYHRTFVVELHQGQDPRQFAQTHGLDYVGPVGSLGTLQYMHTFKTHQNTRNAGLHKRMAASEGVRWVEEQEARRMYTRGTRHNSNNNNNRDTPSDPLYRNQWHLHNTGSGVRAEKAWRMGYTGKGVTIGIVDDGLQHTHPDLSARYRADMSWDYNGRDADPSPNVYAGDFHGTSAAGVAAASCNTTHCGCGAAPDAHLAGLRLIAGAVTDGQEGTALSVHPHDIHIKSNSWGPADNGKSMVMPGRVTREALAQSAQLGRHGKGTIYVWAAGNGRHHQDQCGYDGYASSPYTIAVGALDYNGKQAWYSESCAALMCVAPSSGSGKSITTVDVNVNGHGGYNDGHECNDSFGGTSSACPLAAGLIALVLEARPDLHWRDVQGLVANTSHIVDVHDADWSRNARGYHHSHHYGFGRIDGPDLLIVAKTWQSWSAQVGFSSNTINVNQNIPLSTGSSGNTATPPLCIAHTFENAPMTFVEHVMLQVNIRHAQRGNLRIRLESPGRVVSVFSDQRDDNRAFPTNGWLFTSVRHWGETTANGDWVVCVEDLRSSGTKGQLTSFRLDVFGH